MKKTLKWSLLLTSVIGIIMILIKPEQSTLLNIDCFTFNLSSLFAISRFWDLLIIVPSFLLIYKLAKNDMSFNPGIVIISIISFFFLFAIIGGEIRPSIVVRILGIFSFLNFGMAIQDTDKENNKVTKRLLVSLLIILLVNSWAFGILNAILMASIFLIFYLIFLIILLLCVGGYKLFKIAPKHLKKSWAWMNRE